MLTFEPIIHYQVGTVASLLLQSYAELLSDPLWEGEQERFIQADSEVFANPDTVGKCIFATCLRDALIGFASFDPRQKPELGIIGYNCILPEFRGNGYGKQQILEVLSRFKSRGIRKAVVSKSEHPFFLPAQRMYLSCGFQENKRYVGGPDPRYRLIEYERDLQL